MVVTGEGLFGNGDKAGIKLLWAVGSFFFGLHLGFLIIWIFGIDTDAEGSEIYSALPMVFGVVLFILLNLDLIGVKVKRPSR